MNKAAYNGLVYEDWYEVGKPLGRLAQAFLDFQVPDYQVDYKYSSIV